MSTRVAAGAGVGVAVGAGAGLVGWLVEEKNTPRVFRVMIGALDKA